MRSCFILSFCVSYWKVCKQETKIEKLVAGVMTTNNFIAENKLFQFQYGFSSIILKTNIFPCNEPMFDETKAMFKRRTPYVPNQISVNWVRSTKMIKFDS